MTIATLKPVKRAAKGHNRFCGPAAISIIAGVDTAEAAAVIRHVSRKRSVQGTSNWEVLRSLSLLGFKASSAAKVDPLNLKANPTLAAWLKSDERDGQSLYLIAAGHHWQVVQGRRFCCGLTGQIVSIRDEKVKRRARVSGVWKIEQDRKVALADVLPTKVKVKDTEATTRRKARTLAAKHGIEIETERLWDGGEYYTRIIVWGQPGVCDDEARDPFYGDHYADDWADALERVQEYVKIRETV
jgi:hypothetical protein